jgi:hypothetical protein
MVASGADIRFVGGSSPHSDRPSPLSRRPAMPVKTKIWRHANLASSPDAMDQPTASRLPAQRATMGCFLRVRQTSTVSTPARRPPAATFSLK